MNKMKWLTGFSGMIVILMVLFMGPTGSMCYSDVWVPDETGTSTGTSSSTSTLS